MTQGAGDILRMARLWSPIARRPQHCRLARCPRCARVTHSEDVRAPAPAGAACPSCGRMQLWEHDVATGTERVTCGSPRRSPCRSRACAGSGSRRVARCAAATGRCPAAVRRSGPPPLGYERAGPPLRLHSGPWPGGAPASVRRPVALHPRWMGAPRSFGAAAGPAPLVAAQRDDARSATAAPRRRRRRQRVCWRRLRRAAADEVGRQHGDSSGVTSGSLARCVQQRQCSAAGCAECCRVAARIPAWVWLDFADLVAAFSTPVPTLQSVPYFMHAGARRAWSFALRALLSPSRASGSTRERAWKSFCSHVCCSRAALQPVVQLARLRFSSVWRTSTQGSGPCCWTRQWLPGLGRLPHFPQQTRRSASAHAPRSSVGICPGLAKHSRLPIWHPVAVRSGTPRAAVCASHCCGTTRASGPRASRATRLLDEGSSRHGRQGHRAQPHNPYVNSAWRPAGKGGDKFLLLGLPRTQ